MLAILARKDLIGSTDQVPQTLVADHFVMILQEQAILTNDQPAVPIHMLLKHDVTDLWRLRRVRLVNVPGITDR